MYCYTMLLVCQLETKRDKHIVEFIARTHVLAKELLDSEINIDIVVTPSINNLDPNHKE